MEHCRNGAAYSRNIANSVGHVLRYAMRNATQGLVSAYVIAYVMGDARRDSGTGIGGISSASANRWCGGGIAWHW